VAWADLPYVLKIPKILKENVIPSWAKSSVSKENVGVFESTTTWMLDPGVGIGTPDVVMPL
jgi:hypothetical protein